MMPSLQMTSRSVCCSLSPSIWCCSWRIRSLSSQTISLPWGSMLSEWRGPWSMEAPLTMNEQGSSPNSSTALMWAHILLSWSCSTVVLLQGYCIDLATVRSCLYKSNELYQCWKGIGAGFLTWHKSRLFVGWHWGCHWVLKDIFLSEWRSWGLMMWWVYMTMDFLTWSVRTLYFPFLKKHLCTGQHSLPEQSGRQLLGYPRGQLPHPNQQPCRLS